MTQCDPPLHITTPHFNILLLNVPATTYIYTLSLHDALPICPSSLIFYTGDKFPRWKNNLFVGSLTQKQVVDRKSTRLNSSHTVISYAVFCLKKKITIIITVLTKHYDVRFTHLGRGMSVIPDT